MPAPTNAPANMVFQKVVFGSDHGGFTLKEELKKHCATKFPNLEIIDVGPANKDRCDYPDYAVAAATKVAKDDTMAGVLVCGTGIGIGIVANKVAGIRCGFGHDYFSAQATRAHNDANMISFGERTTGPGSACQMMEIFLTTEFEGGRHTDRLKKLHDVEAMEEARGIKRAADEPCHPHATKREATAEEKA